ncbi:MAG: hypothetical protein RL653_459 [Pseudomonadota bacterium]|jgi:hypothetical protein
MSPAHGHLRALAQLLELGELRHAAERPVRMAGRHGEFWVELTSHGATVELAVGPLRPLPAGLTLEGAPRRDEDLSLDGELDVLLRARASHPAAAIRLLRAPEVRPRLLRWAASCERLELRHGWAWCELPAGDLALQRPAARSALSFADALVEGSRELSLQAATDKVAARAAGAPPLPARRFFAPARPVAPADARLEALHRLARAHLAFRKPAGELVSLLLESGAESPREARGVVSAVWWERALADRDRWPDAVAWVGGAAAWLTWMTFLVTGPALSLGKGRWAGLAFVLAATVWGAVEARRAWRAHVSHPPG